MSSLCLPGLYQTEPAAFCLPCLPGKYEHGDRINCTKCDVEMYQDEAGQIDCKACSAGKGTAKQQGKGECSSCSVGRSGIGLNGACANCPAGQYRSSDMTSNTTYDTSCEPCGKGRYQAQEGQALCLPCIPGKYMDHTGEDDQCDKCAVNFVSSDAGAVKCDQSHHIY